MVLKLNHKLLQAQLTQKNVLGVSCVPETGQELTNLKETELFVAFNDFMFTTLHKHKNTKCKTNNIKRYQSIIYQVKKNLLV